ncbi:MAG: SpoIVB peptidase [[Eubacterium] saphenum]|nr:SpoIVB peptidase [[Eubacterium] saphenum]
MNKKFAKFLSAAATALAACLTAALCCFYVALPCNLSVPAGQFEGGGFSVATLRQTDSGLCYYLGNIPIKPASAVATARPTVTLCGTPFGIKVRSNGVMVISAAENSPAAAAGIKTGDVITEVNGKSVCTNAEFAEAVQQSSDGTSIILERGGGEISVALTPENHGGKLRVGLYVRDSAAGIGTLTFYDKQNGVFGGLGHAVSDTSTGGEIPLKSGEITRAEIFDVVKAKEGSAGELCGKIFSDETVGELSLNTSQGVFGTLSEPFDGKEYEAAFRQEVHTGKATVLTTINGSEPREYDIEIERINLFGLEGSKGMVIRITDPELLEETGGIVRGMSGSPIIQDGRFAGAVTHVLVNDPTRGYAIFAENMLEQAKSAS